MYGIPDRASSCRDYCFKSERVQCLTHVALQSIVNHAVLLDAALALEHSAGNTGRKMISIACQIDNGNLSVWEGLLDKTFDFGSDHCHHDHSAVVGDSHARSKPTYVCCNTHEGKRDAAMQNL